MHHVNVSDCPILYILGFFGRNIPLSPASGTHSGARLSSSDQDASSMLHDLKLALLYYRQGLTIRENT